MRLDRMTLCWIRSKMKQMADAENQRRGEDNRFYYERDSITSLFNFFLDPTTYDEVTKAEFIRDNSFHEPIDMMQISIIGQGPLWIPKPDYVKEREKRQPRSSGFDWFFYGEKVKTKTPHYYTTLPSVYKNGGS